MFDELEHAAVGHEVTVDEAVRALKFDASGLVPAIAQDADSKDVLMLAWMNRESLARTLEEGYACYYSRSRRALWRKGDTSGHRQKLCELRFDCDGDAVLLLVEQTGPACHTNRHSCFYLQVDGAVVRVTSAPA
ncbi:MAG: phosphoribosyl-AMP cyclohydrolase [Pseudomonadales bacterium]